MSADPAKKLHSLLKKLSPAGASDISAPALTHTTDAIVAELVRSFFIWECGAARGERALSEAHAGLADYNELRVCLPHEFERILTEADQHAPQRFLRMRSVLNDIFRREHEISLTHLATLAKRDARAYLDSLEGMHPFVSARVCLLSLGAHAFPADGRLCRLLASEKALPTELDPESGASQADAGSWLEHHILADESRGAYLGLERLAEEADTAKTTPPSQRASKSAAKSGSRGTTEPARPSRKRSAT